MYTVFSSDEAGCPACRSDQFRCQNGQCIDESQVCDGTPQCPDQIDEAYCCKSPDEYRCPLTDVCISVALLCDGMENCADGADESKAVCSDLNRYSMVCRYFIHYLLQTSFQLFFVGIFDLLNGKISCNTHLPILIYTLSSHVFIFFIDCE